MAFEVVLEEEERIIADLRFTQDAKNSCRIVVTNRSLFLPRQKAFAIKDPSYAEKVTFDRVVEVRIQKIKPYFLWALSVLMITAGASATFLMLMPALRGESYTLSGYPPAIAVCGAVIPFISRRRHRLSITLTDKGFAWNPPLNIDRASRRAADTFLSNVAAACIKTGLPTKDERESVEPQTHERANYPIAPIDSEATLHLGVPRNCYHCGTRLRIPRWDAWNGFLFRCSHCGQVHGKSWSAFAVLFASILLNAASFFFTLRWRLALLFFLGFAILDVAIVYAVDHALASDDAQLFIMAVMFLGPVVINSVLLLRHQTALRIAVASRF